MTVYTPNAVFAYKACTDNSYGAGQDVKFMKYFVNLLREGDVVLAVGCGESGSDTYKLKELSQERNIKITLVGVDPEFNHEKLYKKRSDGIIYEKTDYRNVFSKTGPDNRKEIGRQIIDDSIIVGARIIAVAFCKHDATCEETLKDVLIQFKDNGYEAVLPSNTEPREVIAEKPKLSIQIEGLRLENSKKSEPEDKYMNFLLNTIPCSSESTLREMIRRGCYD